MTTCKGNHDLLDRLSRARRGSALDAIAEELRERVAPNGEAARLLGALDATGLVSGSELGSCYRRALRAVARLEAGRVSATAAIEEIGLLERLAEDARDGLWVEDAAETYERLCAALGLPVDAARLQSAASDYYRQIADLSGEEAPRAKAAVTRDACDRVTVHG